MKFQITIVLLLVACANAQNFLDDFLNGLKQAQGNAQRNTAGLQTGLNGLLDSLGNSASDLTGRLRGGLNGFDLSDTLNGLTGRLGENLNGLTGRIGENLNGLTNLTFSRIWETIVVYLRPIFEVLRENLNLNRLNGLLRQN